MELIQFDKKCYLSKPKDDKMKKKSENRSLA